MRFHARSLGDGVVRRGGAIARIAGRTCRGQAFESRPSTINGIRSRLPALLQWLEREAPDIVCLQELQSSGQRVSRRATARRGLRCDLARQSAWNGVAILSKGEAPLESRRGLPGFEDDTHSRYLEAAVGGVLGGVPLSAERQSATGPPKFDYKLGVVRSFHRARGESYTRALIRSCWPATSTWCRPTKTSTTRARG
ncbi:endonuclease/exonuclease/phosphatase family protein [Paraburkholderia dipogonis]|uniref:endonuclease/exonuclease/phosphatase family protein n=1 Tax=Paraburkholderia dipogonis TaxID=1211383 RepID=UPI0035EAAA18